MEPQNTSLDNLMLDVFSGRVVRKDLTLSLKEGANVPVYVLEYLLGMYCASDDPEVIEEGVKSVKKILSENFVRPDESEKIKKNIRELGSFKIIDKVEARLNTRKDQYETTLWNLGETGIVLADHYVQEYENLLVGGIWCMITLAYCYDEVSRGTPFVIQDLKPIQMPNLDMEEIFTGRKQFSVQEWIDLLLRSIGMEPANLEQRAKWHLLNRMIPLVENNYNVIELGPRSTGKSHLYKEISPYTILISGGQTTAANLFYNMARHTVGLVGIWDVVAFDEVANVAGVNETMDLLKDYMASGSFVRGKDSIQANASIVFIGNLNDSVDTLVKTSHLFAPLPEKMIDSAFLDRYHAYIPGWEIPKFRPDHFTNRYGLIVDYLAGYFREMRKHNFGDAINKYFTLGKDLNQRDTIAVRRTVSGLLKLIYPNGEYDKEGVRQCLEYALETRRRIKEQLKKIGGIEFYDVHFSYHDQETMAECFVSIPEQGGNKLIPEGALPPGNLHTISRSSSGKDTLFRFELQILPGTGKLKMSGFGSDSKIKEGIKIAFDYYKANIKNISNNVKSLQLDYHIHLIDFYNLGASKDFALPAFLGFCSAVLSKHVQEQMIVLGDMTLGGTIEPVQSLGEKLQIALDAGAKKLLLPMSCIKDISTVSAELFGKFQVTFYSDPNDAVFKALGVH